LSESYGVPIRRGAGAGFRTLLGIDAATVANQVDPPATSPTYLRISSRLFRRWALFLWRHGENLHALVEAAARRMASTLRSTSASVVAHEHTLMRIAVRFCQTVTPHQQVPSVC